MKNVNLSRLVVMGLMALVMVGLVACTNAADAGSNGGRIFFTEPKDGTTVSSPLTVKWSAEKFKIEPAGDIHPGAGHLHIMVDTPCVAAGQVVPNDATHLHYGKAQTEAALELKPGVHTLCLQAADGAHVALPGDGMKQEITVTVN